MAQTWIFQANPDRFDIDGYLATDPASIRWLVRQRADQMRVGDRVFLWRAIGSGEERLSGVVAEAEIIATPAKQNDSPAALPFWAPDEQNAADMRVDLQIVRIALRDRVRRSWLADDPVLGKTAIFSLRSGTNFLLRSDEGARLEAVWARAGVDWDYAEAVAGMWAYWRTFGGSVSKLPGSAVAEVALRTGRVVGGVYNKVMNFRALDPGDPRAGLPATSAQDRLVWSRFYDAAAQAIDAAALDAEYHRLWDGVATVPAASAAGQAEQQARQYRKLSLPDLLARYAQRVPQKPARPRSRVAPQRMYERDPLVVAIALARAGGSCEVPACPHPLFADADGVPFLEVHHIQPLAVGGGDDIENVACVCPSHHREAHYGANADGIAIALRGVRAAD